MPTKGNGFDSDRLLATTEFFLCFIMSVLACMHESKAIAKYKSFQTIGTQTAAEEVVDMRGGSVELTQTYFYSLVK